MDVREYFAFISYSHKDEKWAEWLHRKLETYRGHKRLVGTKNRYGDAVPQRLYPVFRDRDELEGAGDLPDRIQEALGGSRFLVVICSPDAAKSRWVDEEIRAFKALKGDSHVLALIVSGEPGASEEGNDAQECFPRALRYRADSKGALTGEATEPLAADARKDMDGERVALLKIAAAILGVRFDDLRQRDAQRRFRLMAASVTALAVIAALMSALAVYALYQGGTATASRLATESRFEADKRYDLALMLAAESVGLRDTVQNRSALLSAVLKQPYDIRSFNYHMRAVQGLAFSWDGATLATGSEEGKVVLWDVSSGRLRRAEPLFIDGEISSLAFSPDDRTLAIASRGGGSFNEGQLRFWDLQSRADAMAPLRTADTIWAMSFTEDGKHLVTATGDGQGLIWDVAARRISSQSANPDAIAGFAVAASPDGAWVASGADNGEVALVSLADRSSIVRFPKAHSSTVLGVAFSKRDGSLVTADDMGKVVVWDVQSKTARMDPEEAGIGGIRNIAFSPYGDRLVLGAADGTVVIWDPAQSKVTRTLLAKAGSSVSRLAFSPDGVHLAVGMDSGQVFVANVEEPTAIVTQMTLAADAWDVAIGPKARVAVAATEAGMQEIDLSPKGSGAGRVLAPGFFWNVAVSPDGKTYVGLRNCEEGDEDMRELIVVLAGDASASPTVAAQCARYSGLAFHPQGRTLAVAKLNGTVDLLEPENGWRVRATLGKPGGLIESVDALVFLEGGDLIALGRRNGTAEWWNSADGAMIRSWQADPSGIVAMAVSSKANLLATAGESRSVQFWDAKTGVPYGKLIEPSAGAIDSIALSDDGAIIAILSADTLFLWDVATQQQIAERIEVTPAQLGIGQLNALAFSTDGSYLFSAGTNGQLFMWDFRREAWTKHACYVANREFTSAEWNTYGSRWRQPVCGPRHD